MKHVKLYEQFHSQKLNDNFWRWFGKSKIIDNQGNPLVMLHGTDDNKITNFKNPKGYHFFTSSKDEAIRYTSLYLKNPQPSDYNDKEAFRKAEITYFKRLENMIIKVYIKCERPFDPLNMTDRKKASIMKVLEDNKTQIFKDLHESSDIISYTLDELGYDMDDLEDNSYEILEYMLCSSADNFYLLEHDIVQSWIKSNNYDGFYTIESGIGVNVAVYNTNQIKSINNKGDWSLNTDNIYESVILNFEKFNENVDHILDKMNRKEKISGYDKYCLDKFSKNEEVDDEYTHCYNYLVYNYSKLKTVINTYKSFGKPVVETLFNGEEETYFRLDLTNRKFYIRQDIYEYLLDYYNFKDIDLIEIFNEFIGKFFIKSMRIKSVSPFFINT